MKLKNRITDDELSDDDVVKIIRKMVKQRNESLAQYLKAGRQDLADTESFEIDVLTTYMPDPISEADLVKIVDEAIQTTAAESPQQMGLVIKELKAKFGAELDMAKTSQLVKNKLSN